jgi:hypothetical protein
VDITLRMRSHRAMRALVRIPALRFCLLEQVLLGLARAHGDTRKDRLSGQTTRGMAVCLLAVSQPKAVSYLHHDFILT